MAKQTKTNKRAVTIGNIVFVDSKAYGLHARRKRGTVIPTVLNETLQKNAALTIPLNGQAREVYGPLKIIGGPFKEKMLWQTMLGRMRQARSANTAALLQALVGMELNGRYPLRKLTTAVAPVVSGRGEEMIFTLHFKAPAAGYRGYSHWYCSQSILFFDKDGKYCDAGSAIERVLRSGERESLSALLEAPPQARYWLGCLLVHAVKDSEPIGGLSACGIQVNGMGEIIRNAG